MSELRRVKRNRKENYDQLEIRVKVYAKYLRLLLMRFFMFYQFFAIKKNVELIASLQYRLRMFGVPIDRSTDIFCDNEAVYKNVSTPKSHLRNKKHSILYHIIRDVVVSDSRRMAREDNETNLSDLFTKVIPRPRREFFLGAFTY